MIPPVRERDAYLVKANLKLKTTFQALDIKNLGDLFNSAINLFFTSCMCDWDKREADPTRLVIKYAY